MGEDQIERCVDAALAAFPVAPLPDGFVERTMARIATARPPGRSPAWRPRLGFLDLVLPTFAAFLAWAVGVTAWAVCHSEPSLRLTAADVAVRVRWLATVWGWDLATWPRSVAAPALAAVLCIAVAGAACSAARPRRRFSAPDGA